MAPNYEGIIHFKRTQSELSPDEFKIILYRIMFEQHHISLKLLRAAAQEGLKNPENFVTFIFKSFLKTPQGVLVLFENFTNMVENVPSLTRTQVVTEMLGKLAEMTEQDFQFVQEEGDHQFIPDKRALTTRLLKSVKEERDPKACLNILKDLIHFPQVNQLLNEEGIDILIKMISNLESRKIKSDVTQSLVKKIKINELQAKQLWIHSPTSISTQELIDFHLAFAQNPGVSQQTGLWLL